MKSVFRLLIVILSGLYVSCTSVKFSLAEVKCNTGCIVENGLYHFDKVISLGGGKVDILIVDDNSGSMSSLQKSLSSRFSGFIDELDNQGVDYRIGLTTTDISSNVSDTTNNYPRTINNNGALQDGNLAPFGSYPYLTKDISNRKDLFNATIVRSETINCENFIANWVQQNGAASIDSSADYSRQYVENCPSGDNRDIFAANLTLQKNPSGFIRSDAALAIIILGDSDERNGMYIYPNMGFDLSNMDQPASLINNFWTKYGKSKSLAIHAITVLDDTCLAERANQVLGNPPVAATAGLTHGSIGQAFINFTKEGWGNAVDICFNNYTSQIGPIGASILQQASQLQLACTNPSNFKLTLSPSDPTIQWTQNVNKIIFNKPLPLNSSVHLVYDCAAMN